MKKTVLVTGCNGFIGKAFIEQFREKYDFIGVDVVTAANAQFFIQYIVDIRDKEKIREIFKKHHIDVVLHTAAEKSLVMCETSKKAAYEINYLAATDILELSSEAKCKFVFLSSDQVFDGTKSMYRETAPVHAINYYGKLKILMEHQLLQRKGTAICRTALVFGPIPDEQQPQFQKNCYQESLAVQGYIVQQTRACLMKKKPILLPADEYVSPTHVNLLSRQLDRVIETDAEGILHCCGKDRISRYNMGMLIAKHFGIQDSSCIIRSGKPDPLRPKDVSLDCSVTEKKLGLESMSFAQMLDLYVGRESDESL